MKYNSLHVSATLMMSLLLPTLSIAAETEPNNIDYSHTEDSFTPCGVEQSAEDINLLPPLSETKVGDITYVTGGICIGGVRHMKNIAKDYPLEVVLVEQENGKEVYLADVNINIFDAKDKLLLNASTEGPFLLAKLPDGIYKITAEYNTVMKTKQVTINSKQHKRIVFLWSTTDQVE